MSGYIEPIKIALLVFPFLALVISTIFFFANIGDMADLSGQEESSCIHLSFIYCAPIFW